VNEVEYFAGRKSGAVSAFAVDQRTGELRLLNQQASLGANPCYVDVDAACRFVLIANYTGGNVTIAPIERDGSLGEATDMKQYQGSSINRDRQEASHAHCIVLDPTNQFAYSCDLGSDKIMIFRFDARSGKLLAGTPPWVQVKPGAGPRHLAFSSHESTRGMTPRNFAIDPTGEFLLVANQKSDNIVVFRLDQTTGRLNATGQVAQVPAPVCLKLTQPFR